MRIRITDGRVVDPSGEFNERLSLFVADGHIVAIGNEPQSFNPDVTINASEHIVCPGLIDLSARLREPGQEYKATIESETRAAAKGGITTLCVPPDTEPVIDTPAVAELIHQRAAQVGMVRVEILGALTQALEGERLAEMGALGAAGCLGVSNAFQAVRDTEVMRRAMEYAATFGLTVFSCPQDPWLSRDRYAHAGVASTRLGLPDIPECAETVVVARDLLLAEQTGAHIHFCRLSTARGVDMVQEAQHRGIPVSADVAMHHLYLTELDTSEFNSDFHVRPPLRTQDDLERLRSAVADGTLDAICSDHQPHNRDAKLNPFAATEPGISGLETLLPLALRLVDEGLMSFVDTLKRLTTGPARVLSLTRGVLTVGAPADICIIDPEYRWTLRESDLVSRGHNTPFLGWEMCGRVTHTITAGRVVYEQTE